MHSDAICRSLRELNLYSVLLPMLTFINYLVLCLNYVSMFEFCLLYFTMTFMPLPKIAHGYK